MQPYIIVLFVLTILLASLTQSVSGFGFGIVAVSLMAYFITPYNNCVAVSGLLSLGLNGVLAWKYRAHIRWRVLLPPMASFFVSSALVVTFAAGSADALLKKLLACALILLSVYFAFFSKKLKIKPTVVSGIIAGLLGGVLDGFFGMGGPPVVLYLMSATASKEEYLGTLEMYFTVAALYVTAMRAVNGMINGQVLLLALIGLAAAAAGMLIGQRAFKRMSGDTLRRVVYGFMAVSGVIMLIQ